MTTPDERPAADGGPRDGWDRHRADWAERRRERGWGPPDGRSWGPGRGPRRGFGCLFFLIFLFVAAVLFSIALTIVQQVGPAAGVLAIGVVVLLLIGLGRAMRRNFQVLEGLLDATRRVEGGDYSVRVGTPDRGMPAVRALAKGFDTMVERLDVDERQRRSLLADVSHELRTPLSVISGEVEAMLDGVHPADAERLGAVLDETRVISRLIEDLRTMSLSEAGTLALHPEPTDMDVLLENVVRSAAGAAGTAGVTVRTDVPGDLPVLEVDPVRIQEAIGNLVANAIRHTPPGGTVTVRGSIADPSLEIRVVDTGFGIDPDVLPHVFERFVKSAGSGGSGLGLAIARSLVEAHGGTLEVEATGSAGTTFRARLPLAR